MVFVSRDVADGTAPVLVVAHRFDGEWFFLSSFEPGGGDLRLAHLGEFLERNPEMQTLGFLAPGYCLVRESPACEWSEVADTTDHSADR
jgi:hypothetical protein